MTLLPLSAAAELSPEIQVDLYLVQTEAFIKEQNYAAALNPTRPYSSVSFCVGKEI